MGMSLYRSALSSHLSSSELRGPGIYRITVIGSNKVYVGSSQCCAKRLRAHISMLFNGTHHCIGLQRAYHKYGIQSFYLDIIENCLVDDLLVREQTYIDWYANIGLLYNSNHFSNSTRGHKWTIEQKEAHSIRIKQVLKDPAKKKIIFDALKAVQQTDEYKIKASLSQKKRYDDPESREEVRQRFKKYHAANPGWIRRVWAEKTDKVVCILNKFTKCHTIFSNACDAARSFNSHDSSILACCKGAVNITQDGCIFLFLKDFNEDSARLKITKGLSTYGGSIPKPIGRIDRYTGELLEIYPSLSEASKHTGSAVANITKCCKGKIPTCGGYKWSTNYFEHPELKCMYSEEYVDVVIAEERINNIYQFTRWSSAV